MKWWPWRRPAPSQQPPITYRLNLAQLEDACRRGAKQFAAIEIQRQLRTQDPSRCYVANVNVDISLDKADVRFEGVPVEWTLEEIGE